MPFAMLLFLLSFFVFFEAESLICDELNKDYWLTILCHYHLLSSSFYLCHNLRGLVFEFRNGHEFHYMPSSWALSSLSSNIALSIHSWIASSKDLSLPSRIL